MTSSKSNGPSRTRKRAPATPKERESPNDGKTASSQRRKASTKPVESFTDERRIRIALAAYYRAERRGFAPGYEVEDWLAAEAEID
jgi:hypothetical protein